MQVHRIRSLRRFFLPLLSRLDFDVAIRHHWTSDALRLNLYRHKGYWYHGRARELETMMLFEQLLSGGDFVIEVGGHIGYVSLHLWNQIAPTGRLVVFEPSPSNLPYMRKNVAAHAGIRVVESAVADYVGSATLYEEGLTGQNNSLLKSYSLLEGNRKMAYVNERLDQREVEVACTTIDDFLSRENLPAPSFIKIDVEGAEYMVLSGMQTTLRDSHVAIMVEVTERSADVFRLLKDADYRLFRPDRTPIDSVQRARGNVFCLKDSDQRISLFLNQPERSSQ